MPLLERLQVRIPEAQTEVLQEAITDATDAALELTHRSEVAPAMESTVVQLAEIFYRRMQAAGEASRSEGDVSVSYAYAKEIPEDILKRILAHRKLKAAGMRKTYET